MEHVVKLIDDYPDSPLPLQFLGALWARAEKWGLAYNIYQRVYEMTGRAESMNNVGLALEGMQRGQDARKWFYKARDHDPQNYKYPLNIAVTFIEDGEREKALEWAQKSLKLNPDYRNAKEVIGLACLGLGRWKEGWEGYSHMLGGKFRREVQFKDEPRWNGEKNKTVVFYGEQGLGDEILYASCLPDALGDVSQALVECDKRLEGLFRRSFPNATVFGTRRNEEVSWPNDYDIDASCAMGELPKFYRPTPQSCPKTPYLKADPEKVLMWKSLFKSYEKPVIGLAWTGGRKVTHSARRDVGVENFRPLIEGKDAVYVNLQYQDAEVGDLPIKEFRYATRTPDYDDTAGLVAALDCVVGIHTSVHHLAGALGVPALVLVPDKCSWMYALDDWPWYKNSRIVRQRGNWKKTIEGLLDDPLIRGL